VLLDRQGLDRGLFRPEMIDRLIAEHVHGVREHGHRLWALVMLELWFRNHGEGR
jgi:asparagine synthase (glutamine-hydrolysing)